jgi:hypothetical protein
MKAGFVLLSSDLLEASKAGAAGFQTFQYLTICKVQPSVLFSLPTGKIPLPASPNTLPYTRIGAIDPNTLIGRLLSAFREM